MPGQRDSNGRFLKKGAIPSAPGAPGVKVSVDVSGFKLQVGRWSAKINAAMVQGMTMVVALIHSAAVSEIRNGAKSGRTYTTTFFMKGGKLFIGPPRAGRNLSASHKASAPGESPATDTGKLIGSLAFGVSRTATSVTGTVWASAKYAKWLEYGTRRIKPRPFLGPALAKQTAKCREILAASLARGIAAG